MPLVKGLQYTVVSLGNTPEETHGGTRCIVCNSTTPAFLGEDSVFFLGPGFFGYGEQPLTWDTALDYTDAFSGSWFGMWQRWNYKSYAGFYQYASAITYLLLPAKHLLALLTDELDLQRVYVLQGGVRTFNPALGGERGRCEDHRGYRVYNRYNFSGFRGQMRYVGVKGYGEPLPWLNPTQLNSLPIFADQPISSGITGVELLASTKTIVPSASPMVLRLAENAPGKAAFEADARALLNAPPDDLLARVFVFVLHTDWQAQGRDWGAQDQTSYVTLAGYPRQVFEGHPSYQLHSLCSEDGIERGRGIHPYSLFPSFWFPDSPRRGMRIFAGIEWSVQHANVSLMGQPANSPLPVFPVGIYSATRENQPIQHVKMALEKAWYVASFSNGEEFRKLDIPRPAGSFPVPQLVTVGDESAAYSGEEITSIHAPELPAAGRYNGIPIHYEPLAAHERASDIWGLARYSYAAIPLAWKEVYPSGDPQDFMELSVSIEGVSMPSTPPIVSVGASVSGNTLRINRTDFLIVW